MMRFLIGYGPNPPNPQWPGGAVIAVSIILNYEEGGEYTVQNGDLISELFLTEVPCRPALHGNRDFVAESLYEYGSRAGFWRIMDLFKRKNVKCTIFAVTSALEKNPQAGERMVNDGHEIASHHHRWIDYNTVDDQTQREHVIKAIEIIKNITGQAPRGWYTGRLGQRTNDILFEEYKNHGGLLYNSDSYADDLPYYINHHGPQLIIPYTLDINDCKFLTSYNIGGTEDFLNYLKDSFDVLYEEGLSGSPKMMNVALHCRISGKPGRMKALLKFLDYVQSKEKVWICRRVDIANHWLSVHPYYKDR
jgi:putative urate catabolism protein